MREDLIEILTSLTVRGELSKICLQLCRLGTREEEAVLHKQYEFFKKMKPDQVGISFLFTLDDTSKLVEMYHEMRKN